MSVWDELKEKYGSYKMLGSDVVPLLWDEGDRLQERNKSLNKSFDDAMKGWDKTIDALNIDEKKLEAIRDLVEAYRASGDHSLARAHITLFKIDEVLGDE